jgi:hypothetical protein
MSFLLGVAVVILAVYAFTAPIARAFDEARRLIVES